MGPIRRLLTAKGWSQGELAKRAKIRPSTLSEAMNGRSPRMDTFESIAAAFDVPLFELFITDEQSALLRQAAQNHAQLVKQEELATLVIRQLAPAVAQAVAAAVGTTGQTIAPPAPPPEPKETLPPAEAAARGRLQRGDKRKSA